MYAKEALTTEQTKFHGSSGKLDQVPNPLQQQGF
jgi:hypothetical protein